jgi:hypothetical protein
MTVYAPSSTTIGVGIGTDDNQGSNLLVPALIIVGGVGIGALVRLFREKK